MRGSQTSRALSLTHAKRVKSCSTKSRRFTVTALVHRQCRLDLFACTSNFRTPIEGVFHTNPGINHLLQRRIAATPPLLDHRPLDEPAVFVEGQRHLALLLE